MVGGPTQVMAMHKMVLGVLGDGIIRGNPTEWGLMEISGDLQKDLSWVT